MPALLTWSLKAEDDGLAVLNGIRERSPEVEWVLFLTPGDWVARGDHVAQGAAANYMPPNTVHALPDETKHIRYGSGPILPGHFQEEAALLSSLEAAGVKAAMVPIFWCLDEIGHEAKICTRSVRLVHRDARVLAWHAVFGCIVEDATAALPGCPLLNQSAACRHWSRGEVDEAYDVALNQSQSPLDRPIFIKARARIDQRHALAALKTLFEHMSIHEELWRLEELMKYLPYTLDELPEVDELRALLKQQTGHLDAGERDWYRDGSPSEVMEAKIIPMLPGWCTARLAWLIEQVRATGAKKVAEFGSVDGVSLFTLVQVAPEIEWHGVEVNPKAVEHGYKVARETGLAERFHLHNADTFAAFSAEHLREFDAVACFEVLEHNRDPRSVLLSLMPAVKSEGFVYVTTPLGAWSLHDEPTRSIPLRKDHINAFTVKRMETLFRALPGIDPTSIEVRAVENPSYWEANAWCFGKFKVL